MIFSSVMIQLVNPILCILALLLIYMGYRKGFLSKILSLFSFVVVVLLSWKVAPLLSKSFHILPKEYAPYQESMLADFFYQYANQLLIFAILVVGVSILLFLLKPIILLVKELPVISFANALMGALLGVVEMVLLSFVLLFVLHTPLIKNGQEVIDSSFFSSVEILQDKLFVAGKEMIHQFDLGNIHLLNETNVEEMKRFLIQQGYSDEEIQNFLKEIGK